MAPAWRVLPAGVRGSRHERADAPCQDAFRYAICGDTLIVAVADGAGSAPLAEIGADVAAEAAVRTLRSRVVDGGCTTDDEWTALLRDAVADARQALIDEASQRGVDTDALATTLIAVAVAPDAIACAQVGDGAVVAGRAAADLRCLTVPDRGEFYNETTFVTSSGALEATQVCVARADTRHVAVFSDGLQLLALSLADNHPHLPFFGPLFRLLEETTALEEAQRELEAFLSSPRVRERTDDDLTLILAARRDERPD